MAVPSLLYAPLMDLHCSHVLLFPSRAAQDIVVQHLATRGDVPIEDVIKGNLSAAESDQFIADLKRQSICFVCLLGTSQLFPSKVQSVHRISAKGNHFKDRKRGSLLIAKKPLNGRDECGSPEVT